MDVRRLGVDRVLDEEVHDPYDGRLERHVAQVVDVLVAPVAAALVVDALDDALQRRGGAVVRAVDRLGDRRGRAHHDLHVEAGGLAEVVEDDRVERVGAGHGEQTALHADRAHHVLAQVLRREVLQHWQRRGELLRPHVGQAVLLGHGPQDVLGGDGAEGHESLADQLPGRLRAGQGRQPGNTNRPSSPQQDSYGGNNSGPGEAEMKKWKETAENWGKLPEKERAKAMMELTKDLPPRYREVIEEYFKTLAKSQGQ